MQMMFSDPGDKRQDLILDEPVPGLEGYEDDDDEEGELEQWLVAPAHLRPWASFESEAGRREWPIPDPRELSVGGRISLHEAYQRELVLALVHPYTRDTVNWRQYPMHSSFSIAYARSWLVTD